MVLNEVTCCIAKDRHAIPFRRERIETRPGRMMRRVNVPFGMRHQSQDSPCRIAQSSDIAFRAVRVDRKRQNIVVVGDPFAGCITNRQLPLGLQFLLRLTTGKDDASFGVSDREKHRVDPAQEWAVLTLDR